MKNERAVWEYMNKRNDEGIIYILMNLTQLDMTEQVDPESLYMITEMEKLKKYKLIEQAYLIYLKTNIKISHKEKLMVRIKSRLKFMCSLASCLKKLYNAMKKEIIYK